jgi:hypothetical protein
VISPSKPTGKESNGLAGIVEIGPHFRVHNFFRHASPSIQATYIRPTAESLGLVCNPETGLHSRFKARSAKPEPSCSCGKLPTPYRFNKSSSLFLNDGSETETYKQTYPSPMSLDWRRKYLILGCMERFGRSFGREAGCQGGSAARGDGGLRLGRRARAGVAGRPGGTAANSPGGFVSGRFNRFGFFGLGLENGLVR